MLCAGAALEDDLPRRLHAGLPCATAFGAKHPENVWDFLAGAVHQDVTGGRASLVNADNFPFIPYLSSTRLPGTRSLADLKMSASACDPVPKRLPHAIIII